MSKNIVSDAVSQIAMWYNPSWEIANFHIYSQCEKPDKAIKMLEYNPGLVHTENEYGGTAIHSAAIWDSQDYIYQLHSMGADINHLDCELNTALIDACERGSLNAVKALLDLRALTSIENFIGMKAIDYAVEYNHHEIVNEIENANKKVIS